MSLADIRVTPTLKAYAHTPSLFDQPLTPPKPKRTAPFDEEPGYHVPAGLWLFGNARLLGGNLAFVPQAFGEQDGDAEELAEMERMTEQFVLDGKTIVCGIHNGTHQRVAVVPLRWGAPRILVLSGGFYVHLGPELNNEPFRTARLWRYQFDSRTDLVISRRDPDKQPTYALVNPTVDSDD